VAIGRKGVIPLLREPDQFRRDLKLRNNALAARDAHKQDALQGSLILEDTISMADLLGTHLASFPEQTLGIDVCWLEMLNSQGRLHLEDLKRIVMGNGLASWHDVEMAEGR